jgi:hypothetical protein
MSNPVPPQFVPGEYALSDNVNFGSVVLTAIINPGGLATLCTFSYATEVGYPQHNGVEALVNATVLPPITIGSTGDYSQAIANQPLEVIVSGAGPGLLQGITYYWSVTAANSKGSITSPILSFKTEGTTPGVPVIGAHNANVNFGSVTLSGNVDPNNAPTTITFYYSTELTYNNGVPVLENAQTVTGANLSPHSPLSISTSVTIVNASLQVNTSLALNSSALLPGTTYYWSLTAANAVGSATSGILSFKTEGTAPGPPQLLRIGALPTATTVTISGDLLNFDCQSQLIFIWNQGVQLTNSHSSTTPKIVAGSSGEVPVTIVVENLTASTTYTGELQVTTVAGTSNSGPMMFTTPYSPA